MSPATIQALEEMLRRVLRAPAHGIDAAQQILHSRGRSATLRYRRRLLVALTLAAGVTLVVLGWFAGRWGVVG